jgi:Ni/Co efflux regulator RcnB
MKRFAVIAAICASFLLGMAVSAFAQDERHDERHQEKEARHEERREGHDEKREAHKEGRERHEEARDRHEERREEHRHIADERFREHFGHEHYFAVRHVTFVAGRPHFAYAGYSFEVAQHWPAHWAYTDQCYIDHIGGGYYLFNVRHPGVRVAVAVIP